MFKTFHLIDRASGTLDAELDSSQSSGTFSISALSELGTQSWDSASGEYIIVTIEDEQILCSAMSESGGTATLTISERGYNNTSAATHAASSDVEIHIVKGILDEIMDEVLSHTRGLVAQDITSITDANTHTIAGDYTAQFVAGRAFLFQVSSVWYRAVIRSSSYGGGTTTIELTGDSLPAAGTVQDAGFELGHSIRAVPDYIMTKEPSGAPADNPPSGYSWLWVLNGVLYVKDDAGTTYQFASADTIQKSSHTYAADAEASDAYAITLSPAPTAYTTGMVVLFKANTANTGAATLNVNSLGAKTIKKTNDDDLETGDIESGQIVRVAYDGTNFQMLSSPSGIDMTMFTVAASADEIAAADTERNTTGTGYTKVKEIEVNAGGTYRITFDLQALASGMAYGRVYKNGVAHGTEQSATVGAGYLNKSEDLVFEKGDLIQLYYRASGGGSAWVRNFKVKGTTVPNSTVNTD